MPYNPDDISSLPENVQKLPAKKARMWVHVWNSAYKKHQDEGRAFASAYSVIKKAPEDATEELLDELLAFDEFIEKTVKQATEEVVSETLGTPVEVVE
jgi:cation transport regulator ChaB